jgi:trk system potassium uptake protein
VSPGWIGRPLADLESQARVRIAFVTRFGEGLVPDAGTLYQQGDILHAVMDVAGQDEAERILAAGPGRNAGPEDQDGGRS